MKKIIAFSILSLVSLQTYGMNVGSTPSGSSSSSGEAIGTQKPYQTWGYIPESAVIPARAYLNMLHSTEDFSYFDAYNRQSLIDKYLVAEARKGNVARVKYLLEQEHANPNSFNPQGYSAMFEVESMRSGSNFKEIYDLLHKAGGQMFPKIEKSKPQQ